jgi:hypothetical protein
LCHGCLRIWRLLLVGMAPDRALLLLVVVVVVVLVVGMASDRLLSPSPLLLLLATGCWWLGPWARRWCHSWLHPVLPDMAPLAGPLGLGMYTIAGMQDWYSCWLYCIHAQGRRHSAAAQPAAGAAQLVGPSART